MAKVKEREVEIIETEKSVFESFIASLEAARSDIDEVVKKGYEILGIEVAEEPAEGAEDEAVDINDLNLDELLEAAESYDVTVPNKIVAKGVEAVRDLLKEALGLEEEAPEEEKAPEEEEEEIATKVKTKLKKEIEKKKLLKKK